MKRPFYLANTERKRLKGTGTYSIDNNAFWMARNIVQRTQETVCVMRDGVIVREILPKSHEQFLSEEIAATERKLERLRRELLEYKDKAA